MGTKKRKKNQAGKGSIAFIVVILLVVMSFQIVRLYQKDKEYIARENDLKIQYEEEKGRKEQLSDYEDYIGSREYVEDTAKSKLGMVYDNQIIFREK